MFESGADYLWQFRFDYLLKYRKRISRMEKTFWIIKIM